MFTFYWTPFPENEHAHVHIPLRAMTLLAGFIIAESADIGLLIGLAESFMSMITTWAVSPTFSLTQMNLSDSIVRVLKLTLLALIPTAVSCKNKKQPSNCFFRSKIRHNLNIWLVLFQLFSGRGKIYYWTIFIEFLITIQERYVHMYSPIKFNVTDCTLPLVENHGRMLTKLIIKQRDISTSCNVTATAICC